MFSSSSLVTHAHRPTVSWDFTYDCVCKCFAKYSHIITSFPLFIFGLHRQFLFLLFFFHRNLGKSGLRVSCLGLGELVWRQENIHLCFNPSNKTNVSVSPLVQAPGWRLDHRSLMRWEFCCLSVCSRSRFPSTFTHIALVENTLHCEHKSQCFQL